MQAVAGVANAIWQSGSMLSPAIVGLVFQASHSFPIAFATLALGPLPGAVYMLFVEKHVDKSTRAT